MLGGNWYLERVTPQSAVSVDPNPRGHKQLPRRKLNALTTRPGIPGLTSRLKWEKARSTRVSYCRDSTETISGDVLECISVRIQQFGC